MFNNSTVFVGIDLGDTFPYVVVLDKDGEVIEESRIPTSRNAFNRRFSSFHTSRIAMEVGSHSRWVSQTLKGFGHEVIVADARKLLVAVWHVLTKREVDRHAMVDKVAFKYMMWSWKLDDVKPGRHEHSPVGSLSSYEAGSG